MRLPQPTPQAVRFGAFKLVPRRRQLWLRGTQIPLGSRAFDLLMALIERRDRLASKDELMAQVWGATVVDENNLAAQISALRKVLAADAALAQCLQTVPGRGYRFVADIEFETDAATAPAQGGAGEALALVVMPFENLSSDAEQAYFAQGLSQTVATDLSRIAGLLVIASASAASFEGKSVDVRQVSRELAARYLLTGSVLRSDRKLRINAQLVDGQSGAQIWSERFDGDDGDLLALQDRITSRIANSIGREIFAAAARDGAGGDPRSFDLFLRGVAADNRPQSLESLREQERLFAGAVALDPNHSDAHARLARAILLQVTQGHAPAGSSEETLTRGIAAAERAVALDPDNARAHYAMGLVHVLRGDFERSVLANETAIALDRNFALAHNNLGNSLVHLGNGDDALIAAESALRLDPRGPQRCAILTTMGFARLLKAQTGAAVTCFARARDANPKLPRAHVGAAVALALAGDLAAARLAVDDLLTLVPDYRLSRTMERCVPTSPPRYRRFYEEVLRRGARSAGLPI